MDEVLAYSTSKANYHLDKLKTLQEGKSISPLTIQIDLEAYCNDNCRFCAYREELGYNDDMLSLLKIDKNKLGKADRNTFKPLGIMNADSGIPREIAMSIPEQMYYSDIPAIEITGGGEPTLYKYFDEFLTRLMQYDRQIGLVTNCSQLNDDRIEKITNYRNWIWLRTSFDASNPETHRLVHRTPNYDFNRRIDMLRTLIKKNNLRPSKDMDKIEIGISFIINPDNSDDIEASAKLFRELGASHLRYSWQYDKSGNAELSLQQIEKIKSDLTRIKQEYTTDSFRIYTEINRIDTYNRPNTDFDHCFMKDFVWAIGADALVYPCCIMKYIPNWHFADLRKNTLKEMVDMNRDIDVRKCHPCWLRERNKSIAGAVIKPKHENFI